MIYFDEKTYNNEVVLIFFLRYGSVKKYLGSGSGFKAFLDPDRDFWLDPDSMNIDPKHCRPTTEKPDDFNIRKGTKTFNTLRLNVFSTDSQIPVPVLNDTNRTGTVTGSK